jgi:hypothetical protein
MMNPKFLTQLKTAQEILKRAAAPDLGTGLPPWAKENFAALLADLGDLISDLSPQPKEI